MKVWASWSIAIVVAIFANLYSCKSIGPFSTVDTGVSHNNKTGRPHTEVTGVTYFYSYLSDQAPGAEWNSLATTSALHTAVAQYIRNSPATSTTGVQGVVYRPNTGHSGYSQESIVFYWNVLSPVLADQDAINSLNDGINLVLEGTDAGSIGIFANRNVLGPIHCNGAPNTGQWIGMATFGWVTVKTSNTQNMALPPARSPQVAPIRPGQTSSIFGHSENDFKKRFTGPLQCLCANQNTDGTCTDEKESNGYHVPCAQGYYSDNNQVLDELVWAGDVC